MILADPYPLTVLSPFRLSVVFGGSPKVAAIIACQSNRVPFCGIEYIRVLFSETRDKPKLSFGSGPLAGEHRKKGARVGKVSRKNPSRFVFDSARPNQSVKMGKGAG